MAAVIDDQNRDLISGVLKNMDVDPITGCHEWGGSRDKAGYGYCHIPCLGRRYVHRFVHRLRWELDNGEIPDGLFVRHSCDNRGCLNPDHLSLGTRSENMADMVRRGRARKPSERPPFRYMPGYDRKSRNRRYKLTDEQVREIRAKYRSDAYPGDGTGCSQAELAQAYGVHRATIFDIVNLRSRTDV